MEVHPVTRRLTEFIECAQETESVIDEIAALVGDPSLAHHHEKLTRRVALVAAESIGEPELADDINSLIARMEECNARIEEIESERNLRQNQQRQAHARNRRKRVGDQSARGRNAEKGVSRS